MMKKNLFSDSSDMRSSFSTRSFKRGTYSALLTAAALIVVVLVNLVAAAIPSKYSKPDMSAQGLYTLSDVSLDTVGALEREVNLYLVAETGTEDRAIDELCSRYADESGMITYERRDPVVYPTFLSGYDAADASANSVIVECGNRYKVLDYDDIYRYVLNAAYEYDHVFVGESKITGAIKYVTFDDVVRVYSLTGHGERELSSTVIGSLDSENIEHESLSLTAAGGVPDDASCIIIYAPTSDLSEDELEYLTDYLDDGKSACIFTEATLSGELPNFSSLLEYYGVAAERGIVIEGDSEHSVSNYPYYLLPEINETDITGSYISSLKHFLLPLSNALYEISSHRSTIGIEWLFTTTDSAFIKNIGMDTYDYEEGDPKGPFDIAAAITERYGESETRILLIGTGEFLTYDVDRRVSGTNSEFFIESMLWLCRSEEQSVASIDYKNLTVQSLTLSERAAGIWSVLFTYVIPVIFVAMGIVTVIKRSRR